MVKTAHRNLLVIPKKKSEAPVDLQQELDLLEGLLSGCETTSHMSVCMEVFDLNRYRSIRKKDLVARMLQKSDHRSFVFFFNKN